VLSQHPGLIYASAHDYSLQLLEYEKGYQVVSGSIIEKEPTGKEPGELFSSSGYGYTKLEYFDNGQINIGFFEFADNESTEVYSKVLIRSACKEGSDSSIPMNRYLIPCIKEEIAETTKKTPFPTEPAIVTGGSYPAKGLKTLFLGSLHRATWQTPVSIPYLNLDTTKGGLTPFALGGGRQTTTLKFKANDGKEYAFRSVDKSLVNALPKEFRNTFVATLIKEVTATEYPLWSNHRIFPCWIVLTYCTPDQNYMCSPIIPDWVHFRNPLRAYSGCWKTGPKILREKSRDLVGANDVTRSVGLFRKLYKDNDYIVDAEALGRARVFDMLIGDWGRHEDNWKWAGYDRGDKRVYYPIPRDRDHAFCRWNGVIPYIADREWAMTMVESFDNDFHDIKSLTWPARHVDRFLLSELDYNEWKNISSYIEQTMTDDVIDRAISSLPPEILPVSGLELGKMLKSRRAQLPDAVDEYYSLLAGKIDVVGSNKHELVDVERLANGNVRVDMFKRNKEGEVFREDPMYGREFVRGETKEICYLWS